MYTPPEAITSRDNALIKTLYRLANEGNAYRKLGQIWLEGEHLVSSRLQHSKKTGKAQDLASTSRLVVCQSYLPRLAHFLTSYGWQAQDLQMVVIDDKLAQVVSTLESATPIGLLMNYAGEAQTPLQAVNTVVLDRLQDAGNVGSILRSAAALGFHQIVALKGTAALWSPKVLRAGMGAHFALQLHEQLETAEALSQLQALGLPLLATSSHQGDYLHQTTLPKPCAWLLGHEGQGVCAALQKAATQHIRIWQVGEESLNVAAAAAICLHASNCQ